MIHLPSDFSAFLKSLRENDVDYLLIGGYAVGYHGYVRATADLDILVPRDRANSELLVKALAAFGFEIPELVVDLFLVKDRVVRMGNPPMRIEICTSIDGVEFYECFADRIVDVLDGVEISIISLNKLKTNKLASGRLKDLDDLEHLP